MRTQNSYPETGTRKTKHETPNFFSGKSIIIRLRIKGQVFVNLY